MGGSQSVINNITISPNITRNALRQDPGNHIPFKVKVGAEEKSLLLHYSNEECDYTNAITRIQFSFSERMAEGLEAAGFTKIEVNWNPSKDGSPIYMWYLQGKTPYDIPIVDLNFSCDAADDALLLQPLWERCSIDVDRDVGGNWFHLWMKRALRPFICDVTTSDNSASDAELFRQGYTRIDETTNRGAGGADVFIFYRQTPYPVALEEGLAIRDLQVSLNQEEEKTYKSQGYDRAPTNLNEGTAGPHVFLWYKKQITEPAASQSFKDQNQNLRFNQEPVPRNFNKLLGRNKRI
ncbi:PREDICTED: uncharacterized protein LOC107105137 [Cyprinodon variegatus]|uniref:uncharacterized protein LOC107105137 n=1 Tax=Cyprinodon variegatus TaxID=28743 RepID=UPI000742C21B|nr:PREDICTED: uncharacterized protein LOC107105137 [Cyprinodon variegatus]